MVVSVSLCVPFTAFPVFASFASSARAAHLSAYFNWISHTSGAFSQDERASGMDGTGELVTREKESEGKGAFHAR